MRVLGRIRLSKEADETGTSIERQRESIEAWSKMHDHQIVGWAVDSGVSGSLSPFDTPELGLWLKEPQLHEWDVLVAYRLDRLSRRVIPLNELFGFIQTHGKTLASVSESLDLSTWIGRLVANVIAGVAEGELEAIRERNLGSQLKVRQLGRWHGGPTPYGYTTEKRTDGWYLVPDEDERRIIREEILPRILGHESAASIAQHLNNVGAPTRSGAAWQYTVVRRMMRGRRLIGQSVHLGRVVTDDDGLPLQCAEPILTADEHQRVLDALDARAARKSARGFNPLAGLVFCYWCGAPLYYQASSVRNSRPHPLYRCSRRNRDKSCDAIAIKVPTVVELVEEHLLASVGDVPRQVKVFTPGTGKHRSVADLDTAIGVCRRERDLGLYEGDDEAYFARLQRLVGKRKELEALPDKEPGFEWKPLGETYRQAWERMNLEERRTMLLDSKVSIKIGRRPGVLRFELYEPEEVLDHLTQKSPL